ncbi:DUF3274 domain-containing protein [Chitinivorax sp. B]|uniref:T6SS effector phospholipase Tle3 domain-containing protein n=1 Tax=Chitinivorax sp. B TaxID=2502235 RepID=UPI0014852E92|nr:DUF3274 domain-containing protein [Chitinivorax sp. B]
MGQAKYASAKAARSIGRDQALTQTSRERNKTVNVQGDMPGNIIVIHGVNDVGTGYGSVEGGLCEGLRERLGRNDILPCQYREPTEAERQGYWPDPDAVFFKRDDKQIGKTPVIPFYWGFREIKDLSRLKYGQFVDRFGNRLDKDYSKGGGPFANATSSLPDMWNRGKWAVWGALDAAADDPLRPVLNAPGRLYMVLAAKRLAALVDMIRDYDTNETVTIVAHSQGCMVSLLAQAFLLEQGLRPADVLILTHPPYSLEEGRPVTAPLDRGSAGEDDQMRGNDKGKRYDYLKGGQTFEARLQTLVNIVQGVCQHKHATPAFQSIKGKDYHGMVGGKWQPTANKERDNRGKVYLYFCPEDMTVALENVQGIGWQGVPTRKGGTAITLEKTVLPPGVTTQQYQSKTIWREPLKELGMGFFQRVFTAKKRPDPKNGQPPLIGQDQAHDFTMWLKGENFFSHVATGWAGTSKMDVSRSEPDELRFEDPQRVGVRTINGEPLNKPVTAVMYEGAYTAKGGPVGAKERVDMLDPAIAISTDRGFSDCWRLVHDPDQDSFLGRLGNLKLDKDKAIDSPHPPTWKHQVVPTPDKRLEIEKTLNHGKETIDQVKVVDVYACFTDSFNPSPTGQLLVKHKESPRQAQLRWQNSYSERSFHGAIFGSWQNHRQVTAYDVAIGQGKASSDPEFAAYLCAVADWRLQQDEKSKRPGILKWTKFLTKFAKWWAVEDPTRKALIEDNAKYYSSGQLPPLPLLPEGLPKQVICQSLDMAGKVANEYSHPPRIGPAGATKGAA